MNALQRYFLNLASQGYFVTERDLPELIKLNRLCLLLVRCGQGRFLCPAQDLQHFMQCVEAGKDYVRDVSVPETERANAAYWRGEETPHVNAGVINQHFKRTAPDGHPRHGYDYGGSFDGSQVVSDATPGL